MLGVLNANAPTIAIVIARAERVNLNVFIFLLFLGCDLLSYTGFRSYPVSDGQSRESLKEFCCTDKISYKHRT